MDDNFFNEGQDYNCAICGAPVFNVYGSGTHWCDYCGQFVEVVEAD
jgi:uncharacterized Zn finger protein (UPF0148 family)